MANPLQYIQTLQNPMGGSNLPNVVKALQGGSGGNPFAASNSMMNSAANTMNQAFGGDNNSGNKTPSSTFLGTDYNQLAPGSDLSGSEMAQAAQAGVASGLTYDPSTGNVY